jgi:hypothetical protein
VRYTKREKELQAKTKRSLSTSKKKGKQNDDALISSCICTGENTCARMCVYLITRERDRMVDVYDEQKKKEGTVQKTCAKFFYFSFLCLTLIWIFCFSSLLNTIHREVIFKSMNIKKNEKQKNVF